MSGIRGDALVASLYNAAPAQLVAVPAMLSDADDTPCDCR